MRQSSQEIVLHLAHALGRGARNVLTLIEPCIIDRHSGLCCYGRNDALDALGKSARFGMTERQSADYTATARYDGNGQVAAHRKMSLRHAVPAKRLMFAGGQGKALE
jgi:hypothetical protein